MSKLVDKIIVVAASAVLAFTAAGSANATTWIVTNVLTAGNEGGFAASTFHDARGNEMSGSNLATISGSAAGSTAGGLFDDVTGALTFSATVTQGSSTFTMELASGTPFLFNGSGFLASNNTLDLTFSDTFNGPGSATIAANTVTEMGFMLGDVCCTGSNDPNSFTQPGADPDERWMTLWGANNFNVATGHYDDGTETTVGMDLRIRMVKAPTNIEVPAPGATIIFALGLVGMGCMKRRKTV
tara:strand:+ start:16263 stop:16988 length:726 start_codon:yes stop_codon:yes gene_type:complete